MKILLMICLSLLPIFQFPVYSEDEINVTECNPYCSIGERIGIFEDKQGNMKYSEILSKKDEIFFERSKQSKPNFGYTASVYWVKFILSNNDRSKSETFYLEVDYPPLDYASLFYTENGSFIAEHLGDQIPFHKRKIAHQNSVFQLNLKGSREYFMRFESQGSVSFPLNIWEPSAFHNKNRTLQLFYGIYCGIAIIMILYNIFIYVSIRDVSFIYYVFYLAGVVFFNLSMNGIQYEYFLSSYPSLTNTALPFSLGFIGIGGIAFTRTFLDSKVNTPKLDTLLRFLIYPCVIVLIGSFFVKYSIIIKIAAFISILFTLTLFATGIAALLNGYRPARFYVLSWSVLLLGIFIFTVKQMGFLPVNFLTVHGTEVGSAFEIIFLSLALADKMNILKRAKENAQKETIENQKVLISSYARFVPEQLLTFLGKDIITEIHLGDAVEKEMTVLFSDIRSFTTMSEGMTPDENFGFINSYMAVMAPVIRRHGGFIDKYIGDAIMALFPEKPSDAIDAGIAMLEELHLLNVKRREQGFPGISIGIGIHTGKQMLGIIGERERLEGTVISDVVNTASRLEGLTKTYSSSLLVSQDVIDKIDNKDKYYFRHLDTVKVKGKNQAVHILEILNGNSERIVSLKLSLRDTFEKGLEFYIGRNLDTALKCFQEVLEKDPKDKASDLYVKRCRFYIEKGISPDWDGAEKLDFK